MKKIIISVVIILGGIVHSNFLFAHCDTRNGPVVKAAREALQKNNINLVLIWVAEKDEQEVKALFGKTMAIRNTNQKVREIVDEYFFETVVRLHRQSEGMGFTGIKDEEPEPAVLAAERAIERKSADSLVMDIGALIQQGLDQQLTATLVSASYNANDVKAGRNYIANYIVFVNYVEALYHVAAKEKTAHAEDSKLTITPAIKEAGINNSSTTQFYFLLIVGFVIMALLMIVASIFNRNMRRKYHRHDLHDGMAQHLAQ